MSCARSFLLFLAVVVISSSCTITTRKDVVGPQTSRINNFERNPENNYNYTQLGHFREFTESKIPDSQIAFGTIPPNPFGSSNYFRYSLPESCDVNLGILTLTGVAVDSVILGIKPPGGYKIAWNPVNISNGVYIVKLTACDTTFTTKMTLVK